MLNQRNEAIKIPGAIDGLLRAVNRIDDPASFCLEPALGVYALLGEEGVTWKRG